MCFIHETILGCAGQVFFLKKKNNPKYLIFFFCLGSFKSIFSWKIVWICSKKQRHCHLRWSANRLISMFQRQMLCFWRIQVKQLFFFLEENSCFLFKKKCFSWYYYVWQTVGKWNANWRCCVCQRNWSIFFQKQHWSKFFIFYIQCFFGSILILLVEILFVRLLLFKY